MTRRDALALIRAMKENDHKANAVTIDRTASGAVTFGVKVSAKSVRLAQAKAEEVFAALGRFADEQTRAEKARERKRIDDELNRRLAASGAQKKATP